MRDGIVGPRRRSEAAPCEDPPLPDLGSQMPRWEPWVRRQVINFDLWSSLCFTGNRTKADGGADADNGIKLQVRDDTIRDAPANADPYADAAERNQLVKLLRPSSGYILENQLDHVFDYADLRRDRAPEIVAQASHFENFFASVCHLDPQTSRFTFELIEAFRSAVVAIQMRTKHAFATRRPVDFSAQIMPMIPTPGHSSFPAGHAVEAFMLAYVLAELIEPQAKKVYPGKDRYWRDVLMRLAARISVNRVVAGLHFPVDLAAGMVLGLQLGRYFVAAAKGGQSDLTGWKFDAEKYGKEDFPWRKILRVIDSDGKEEKTTFLERLKPFTVPRSDQDRSPLCWLWTQAVNEWR